MKLIKSILTIAAVATLAVTSLVTASPSVNAAAMKLAAPAVAQSETAEVQQVGFRRRFRHHGFRRFRRFNRFHRFNRFRRFRRHHWRHRHGRRYGHWGARRARYRHCLSLQARGYRIRCVF